MNIEHLRLFVRLAAIQNISQAGQTLGLSPAVASAHLTKLEQSLNVRLISRTTRSVSLTQEGQDFLPHAENIIANVEAAKSALGVGDTSPTGTLRITAPSTFARLHLQPIVKDFLSQYPELDIDLMLSDTIMDLVQGGFDLAIRNADLKDSTLVARKLANDKRIICASPEYIEKYGEPKCPKDLKDHQCINLTGGETWSFQTKCGLMNIKTRGRFKTDNGDAMRDATCDGLGLSINSRWSSYKELKEGRLIQVLKDYPLASDYGIWAVYPSSRLLAPKVRVFIDYLVKCYQAPVYWDQD